MLSKTLPRILFDIPKEEKKTTMIIIFCVILLKIKFLCLIKQVTLSVSIELMRFLMINFCNSSSSSSRNSKSMYIFKIFFTQYDDLKFSFFFLSNKFIELYS